MILAIAMCRLTFIETVLPPGKYRAISTRCARWKVKIGYIVTMYAFNLMLGIRVGSEVNV